MHYLCVVFRGGYWLVMEEGELYSKPKLRTDSLCLAMRYALKIFDNHGLWSGIDFCHKKLYRDKEADHEIYGELKELRGKYYR